MAASDDAAGLVENDLELNLNEPNKLGDVSWFEPAKYVGIWWGMISNRWTWAQGDRHGATTERTKDYIDFAAKNDFRGVLVDHEEVAPPHAHHDEAVVELAQHLGPREVLLLEHALQLALAAVQERLLDAALLRWNFRARPWL